MAPLARRRRIARYDIENSTSTALDVESRRALAVFRALDLNDDSGGVHALLSFARAPARREQDQIVITKRECSAVASALRKSGYPLTDDGLSRFKEERGYSRVIRISPDVAAAFGRYADGMEARLQISKKDWRRLDTEARRALKIMVLIGRNPRQLVSVRKVLGLTEREPAKNGVIPVGRLSAKRLLEWAESVGISLGDVGLKKLLRAVPKPDLRKTSGRLEHLSEPIARWIIGEDAPPHEYRRLRAGTSANAPLVSRRTFVMLGQAEEIAGHAGRLRVIRGGYEQDNGRGAHPPKGGGVVDLVIEGAEPKDLVKMVAALRRVGFAAWYRPDRTIPHIHAVAIGDRELGPAAQWQIKSYFQGRDGRSRCGEDPHRRLSVVLPHWVEKFGVRYR